MLRNEQAKMLRDMAQPLAGRALEYDLRSIVSDNAGHIDLARLEKSLGELAASRAAALTAGAEALEAMSLKQGSAREEGL